MTVSLKTYLVFLQTLCMTISTVAGMDLPTMGNSWVCTSDIVPDSVTVQLSFFNGMRKTRRKLLAECNSSKTTCRN